MFLLNNAIDEQIISLSLKEATEYDKLYSSNKAPSFEYIETKNENYYFIITNENYQVIKKNYPLYSSKEKEIVEPVIWQIFFEKIKIKNLKPIEVYKKNKHEIIKEIQKDLSTISNKDISLIYEIIKKQKIQPTDNNTFCLYK